MLSSLKHEQQKGFNLHSLTWLLGFTCSHEESSSVAILDLDLWTLNIVHGPEVTEGSEFAFSGRGPARHISFRFDYQHSRKN